MSVKKYLALGVMKCLQILPIKNNRIVFCSFFGHYYNDLPRLVSEKLAITQKFDIVWIADDNVQLPAGIKRVRPESIKELIALSTSHFWIDNSRKSSWIRKKKNQVYFQTWHGPVCIKAIEKDAPLLNYRYVERAKNDSKMIDFLLSQCEWRTKNFERCFWYSGEYIKGDTSDISTKKRDEATKKVRNFYHLNQQRIVVYAPTFRSSKDMSCYDMDFELLKSTLSRKFGGEWIVIFRLHPNIAHLYTDNAKQNNVYNGSSYAKLEDLIDASDILITDYSGCMFDALRREKIVFLFARDYEQYIANERRLYFDLERFPAPMAKSNESLMNIIIDFEYEAYIKQVKELNKELGYYSEDGIQLIANKVLEISGKRRNNK